MTSTKHICLFNDENIETSRIMFWINILRVVKVSIYFRLRRSTWTALVRINSSERFFSRRLLQALSIDPIAPILDDKWYPVLQRRLTKVISTIEKCAKANGGIDNVLVWHFSYYTYLYIIVVFFILYDNVESFHEAVCSLNQQSLQTSSDHFILYCLLDMILELDFYRTS